MNTKLNQLRHKLSGMVEYVGYLVTLDSLASELKNKFRTNLFGRRRTYVNKKLVHTYFENSFYISDITVYRMKKFIEKRSGSRYTVERNMFGNVSIRKK